MFDDIEKIWTKDSKGYDELIKRQLSNSKDVNHWMSELSTCLDNKKNLDVIDVGCGPGFFSIILSRIGCNVTSIDGSIGMVNCAKSNLRKETSKVNVYKGDVVKLDKEKNNSKDAIVSRDVVWTLYDPKEAYKRWMEVLKPGGKVIVFDGNYRHTKESLLIKLWKNTGKVLMFITEGKWPRKTHNNESTVLDELEFCSYERPAKDKEILEELGYEVSVVDDKYRNSFKHLEYWKYGYQGRKFRIIATKPLKNKKGE